MALHEKVTSFVCAKVHLQKYLTAEEVGEITSFKDVDGVLSKIAAKNGLPEFDEIKGFADIDMAIAKIEAGSASNEPPAAEKPADEAPVVAPSEDAPADEAEAPADEA